MVFEVIVSASITAKLLQPYFYCFGHYTFRNYFKELTTSWRRKRKVTYSVK